MCSNMCTEEYGLQFVNNDTLSEKTKRKLCNQHLSVNRSIISCSLNAYKSKISRTVNCLDGYAGCGIHAMLWQKYLHENIQVTANEYRSEIFQLVKSNVCLNNLELNVSNQDPNVIMRTEQFDFIFLNCKTTASHYLDSAFAKMHDDALLVITTSEDPSLYWQAPDVALRHYGGNIVKTSYHREVSVRLVIAEMARVAAKYSKGLQVLCVIGYKSQQSSTIFCKVKKGAASANASLQNVQRLVHCSLCEERKFIPLSGFVIDSVTSLLDCECSKNTEGKTAYELGPLWSGDVFDTNFIQEMIDAAKGLPWEIESVYLLKQILDESYCFGQCVKNEEEQPNKKVKLMNSSNEKYPCFYYNTHRHSPKSQHLIKINKIVDTLRKSGFRACRTHFDPEAVRTNASLKDLIRVLQQH